MDRAVFSMGEINEKGKIIDVFIPPLRNDDSCYEYLSKLSEAICGNPQHNFIFRFNKCSTISHNGLAILGALGDYLKCFEQNSKSSAFSRALSFLSPTKVGFSLEEMNENVMSTMEKLGFWNYVKKEYGVTHNENYIGYRQHDLNLDDSQIIDHLSKGWLTNAKLKMSDKLRDSIISSIYEVFVNAYGHGLKENHMRQSVISCGLHDEKSKELSLSVVDFGGGIIERVQAIKPELSPKEAFNWALIRGNSTRTDSSKDMPRGLGFHVLSDFIHLNGGDVRICSGSYMAKLNIKGEYNVSELPGVIKGTLVSVTIKCNENKYYRLKSEDNCPPAKSYF